MKYKVLVIDDRVDRQPIYNFLLTENDDFDLVFCSTEESFLQNLSKPFDAYILDAILDQQDWNDVDALDILEKLTNISPRPAPVFLVSNLWGSDNKVLDILNNAGSYSKNIVQYIAWTDFVNASAQNNKSSPPFRALYNKLLYEMHRWHQRSTFRPAPDQSINILIISDVQYGDPNTAAQATYAENEIVCSLKQERLIPDLVAIAGDITHSGRPDQFMLAKERIEHDLLQPLWGPHYENMRDRIILVPGNHDVNLRFSACDVHRFDLDKKGFETETVNTNVLPYNKTLLHGDYSLEPFRRFAYELTGDQNWSKMANLCWYDRRFLHCGFGFYVLNSVASLNYDYPTRGSFNEDSLRQIIRNTGGSDENSIFKIAISHHGLRSPGMGIKETEIDNWGNVAQSFFIQERINAWLHGHYHYYNIRSLNDNSFADNQLWLVQVPTMRIGVGSRGFCNLKLKRENNAVVEASVSHYDYKNSKFKFDSERVLK